MPSPPDTRTPEPPIGKMYRVERIRNLGLRKRLMTLLTGWVDVSNTRVFYTDIEPPSDFVVRHPGKPDA